MRELMLVPFLVLCMIVMPVLPSPTVAQENGEGAESIPSIGALERVARHGYFEDAESYARELEAIEALRDRDLDKSPLTEQEATVLQERIEQLQKGIPLWIDRLIEDAKALETDNLMTFTSASWEVLKEECQDLVHNRRGAEEPSPLELMKQGFAQVKAGLAFDWRGAAEAVDAESQDCVKHVRAIVAEVRAARQALDKELDELKTKLEKKLDECAEAVTEAEKEACEQDLNELDDQIQEKVEKRKRLKKVEDQGDAGMTLLGYLAIVVGIVIGVYCCPRLGASIAAWGGKTVMENQPKAGETHAYDDVVSDGRQRMIDQAGAATEQERAALRDELVKQGFEEVPFEGVPDGVMVQIVRSATEIRVYLVKSRRLVASLTDDNTVFLGTASGIQSLHGLQNLRVVGDVFGPDNIVLLQMLATAPDGARRKLLVAEQSVGAQQFSVTVDQ